MNKGRKLLIAIVLSAVSLIGTASASLAWFVTSTSISGNTSWTGFTDGGYYESGSGRSDDPFIISTPKHLYNLAWLQDIGKYNLDTNNDGNLDNQVYFKLKNDLDMSGYVLPPIGTEQYPFLGNFDGNNKTISNLTTSNHFSDYGTNHPRNVSSFDSEISGDIDVDQPRIVGFFGTVGDVVDYETVNYSAANNQINNVTLNDYTVQTSGDTEDLLIGLAAGYVNGTLSGVKVDGDAKLTVGGETSIASISNKLSDYSLVGYTTKTGTDSNGTYKQKVSQYYHEGGEGQTPDWGGSIAIKDLYNRLATINSSYAAQNTTVGLSYDDVYSYTSGDRVIHDLHKYNSYNMSASLSVYNEDTVKSGGTYNAKIGAVQMAYGDSGIYYLSGGHYSTYRIADFYIYEGVYITDGTNYLRYDSGSLINVTDENNATLWDFDLISGDSYYIKGSFNGTSFYLYNNSGSLAVATGSPSANTAKWTVTKNNGKIRITNSNYVFCYLLNKWRLVKDEGKDIVAVSSDYNGDTDTYYISTSNTSGNTPSSTSNSDEAMLFYVDGNYLYGYNSSGTKLYLSVYYETGWFFPTRELRLINATGQSNYHYFKYYGGTGNGTVYTLRSSTKYYLNLKRSGLISHSYDSWEYSESSVGNANIEVISANDLCANDTLDDVIRVEGPEVSDYRTEATGKMDYYSDQDNTYLPINVDNNLEPIARNTGYLIGGSTFTSAGSYTSDSDNNASNAYGYYGYGNVRISSFYTISDRLTNYDSSSKHFKTNSVYTYDSNGLHTINDSNNTYSKYAASKTAIESKLGEGSTIYGLHFMDATISADNLVNARYVKVNGTEYTTGYQMPANCFDFNLKQKGFVNFFAGTYGNKGTSATTVDSFFSLHLIKRDGANVDDIYEIQEIYEDQTSENKALHSYVYKVKVGNSYYYTTPYSVINGRNYILDTRYLLTDTTHGGFADGVYHLLDDVPNNYVKVFDMSWLKDHSYFTNSNSDAYNKAFYFEIPINAGEYALGSVTGRTFGAYLIYLDIGANASETDEVFAYAITTFSAGLSYPVGVDFATTYVKNSENNDYNKGGNTLCLFITSETSGDLLFTTDNINISVKDDLSTASTYSYKGDAARYAILSDSGGVNTPNDASEAPNNGVREIHISLEESTSNSTWEIVLSEALDAEGNIVSREYTQIYKNGVSQNEEDIPFTFVLADIEEVVVNDVITITRISGSNTFNAVPTYSTTTNPYDTVEIALDLTGITVNAHDKASGYVVSINGVTMNADPQTYLNP